MDVPLPEIKPEALLSLTKKIEANLNKSPLVKQGQAQRAKPKEKRKNTSQNSKKHQVTETPSNSKSRPIGNELKPHTPSIPNAKIQGGKKRLRDGKIKGLDHSKSTANGTQPRWKVGRSRLEKEAQALEKTAEDYKLFEGALSGSEIEGDHKEPLKGTDANLGKDVLQFVQDIRMDKADVNELNQSPELEREAYVHNRKMRLQPHKSTIPSTAIEETKKLEGKKSTNRLYAHLVGFVTVSVLVLTIPSLMTFFSTSNPSQNGI